MPIFRPADLDSLPREEAAHGVAPTIATTVSAERLARQIEDLGPLPTVALEVMELTENPDSDARDLQEAISRDAVIAAKVLKMANSAFFSKGRSCQTLQEGATRLGMKMIRNLVMGSCVTGMMGRDLPHYGYAPFGLPRHSLALAVLCGELQGLLGLPRSLQDELFLDGLLHDVGKLTLSGLLPAPVLATGVAGVERERLLTGTDHADVGIMMARHWKLPEHVTTVIACHHHPDACAGTGFEQHVAAVHVGDWLLNRHRVGLADTAAADQSLPHPWALTAAGLGRDELEPFAEEAGDAVQRTLEFCNQVL